MGQRSVWENFQLEHRREQTENAHARRPWPPAEQRIKSAKEKAERQADRQAGEDTRIRQQLLDEKLSAAADSLTKETHERLMAIQTTLVASLGTSAEIPFDALKRQADIPPFDPGDLARENTPPSRSQYEPKPPTGLAGLFGGRSRYEREKAAAEELFHRAEKQHREAEAQRLRRLAAERARYEQELAAAEEEVRAHNRAVDDLRAAFLKGEEKVVEDYFTHVLDRAVYPVEVPGRRRLAYRREPRELWVEMELPDQSVVPTERGFRYVKSRQKIEVLPRQEKEVKQVYGNLVAQLALCVIRDCFSVNADDLIATVVFNGRMTTRDKATGKRIRPHLVSVSTTRETFDELELEHLDPAACLKHLNALVSPNPYDLVAVEPVVDFDLSRYKFIDEVDAASGLDGRPNIVEMDPLKFEQLIRQLFEKRGLKSWTTQSSRDDGVDGVVVNEDPVMGGVCIIQAKRYKNAVSPNDVRALAGSIEVKRSGFGGGSFS